MNPNKVILAFGKEEEIIKWCRRYAIGRIVTPIYHQHGENGYIGLHIGINEQVELVHCGPWDSQTFNLYLDAIAYYKKIPRNTYL